MEEKKLLRRFQLRLLWQAVTRSVLWGLAFGGAALFVCSLVWHILIQEPAMLWLVGSAAVGFVVGFVPCMIYVYPTKKRTARALDKTGLQERAGTMLAFEKQEGLLVELQRKDAAEHIQNAAVTKLKLRVSLKEILAVLISAVLCAGMLLIPYDLLAPPPEKPTQIDPWEQQVHTKINDLRQQLREAELNAEALAEIDAILAQLEQDLLNTDSQLEQAALLQDAQEKIQDVLYNSISRRVIGRALQQYDLTTALGATLCLETEYWEITEEMIQMCHDISGPTKQLTRLGNNISNAMEISGVGEEDELRLAFMDFSTGLIDMANYTIGPDAEQGWTMNDLEFLFEISEKAIRAALEQQAHDEAEVAEMDGMIQSSLQSLANSEDAALAPELSGSKTQNGGGGNQQPQGGGDGNSSGTPVGGMFDSGDSNTGRTTMLEGIYDPVSGDVEYGEVFALYYAQYLKALDAGEIPEELRAYFERYFSSLS